MPGETNFPTGLDTIPIIPDGLTTEEDDTGFEHDILHNTMADAIMALQAKVGIDDSAVSTSLDYRVAALEDGGGAAIDGVTTPTTDYTLVLTDKNNVVRMNVATANTVTVPPNSSVPFPLNTPIWVEQEGAGRTQLVAGSGVTFKAPVSSGYYIGRRYGRVMLVQIATDVW
jgi:hypothetical protein